MQIDCDWLETVTFARTVNRLADGLVAVNINLTSRRRHGRRRRGNIMTRPSFTIRRKLGNRRRALFNMNQRRTRPASGAIRAAAYGSAEFL